MIKNVRNDLQDDWAERHYLLYTQLEPNDPTKFNSLLDVEPPTYITTPVEASMVGQIVAAKNHGTSKRHDGVPQTAH